MSGITDSDWLCTMDVASLYTNVPHKEGREALHYYLDSKVRQIPSTELLLKLSEVVLTKNYFRFENTFYLQRQGVSMGSPFSPNYVNLFMEKFEEDHVYNNNSFSALVKCWFRYIDDLFFVFTETSEELELFTTYLDSRVPTISFTLEASRETVAFFGCESK